MKAENSDILTDLGEIPERFHIHFIEIGPKLASEIHPVNCIVNPEDILVKVNSTFELKRVKSSNVLNILEKVNIAKATSHDKISNEILIAAPNSCSSDFQVFDKSFQPFY